jgi:hypothetical protein
MTSAAAASGVVTLVIGELEGELPEDAQPANTVAAMTMVINGTSGG